MHIKKTVNIAMRKYINSIYIRIKTNLILLLTNKIGLHLYMLKLNVFFKDFKELDTNFYF